MILVDTNVIIDLWNHEDAEESTVFNSSKVCICGVVRSELLHGAYSEKNLNEISSQLDLLTEINIKDNEWDGFGRFLYVLRINGLTVPYADALISYIAILNNCEVWTKDKHFRAIQTFEPKLKLFRQ